MEYLRNKKVVKSSLKIEIWLINLLKQIKTKKKQIE